MTEAEWNACADPQPMLEFLRGKASDRKLRLFAVACCRHINHLLIPESQQALEVAEMVAEGKAGSAQRKQWRDRALHAGWVSDPATRNRRGPAKASVCDALTRRAVEAAMNVSCRCRGNGFLGWRPPVSGTGPSEEERFQVGRLRCIFGYPLRAVMCAQSWSPSPVYQLAESIYTDRSFDALPILADALEDAGCTNADILNHCRQPGDHVRGCWVVDLLLGKQ